MNKRLLVIAVVVALAAAGGGWWYAHRTAPHQHQMVKMTDKAGTVYWTCPMHPQVRQDEPGNCPVCGMALIKREVKSTAAPGAIGGESAQRKPLYWYDPMHPDQHFDQPGRSPFMDMELVAKYAQDSSNANSTVVAIDPRMAQNLGMRTAEVKRGTFWQRIDTVGSVAVDETRMAVVEARAQGWVERLDVRAVGDTVRKGQVVAGLYAPELLAAQEELALAQKLGDGTLIDAAQNRLKLLNAGRKAQRQNAIVAPLSGVVTELMVRQGAAVAPGVPLMKLADLSKIWILVEVPEAQSSWVAVGKTAEARLTALPDKTFDGKVEYVYPLLDVATRTLRARLAFDNADGALKPGMYAEVTLFGGGLQDVTLVPSEAVIRTGTRSVVLVAEGDGRFRPVSVTLGAERNDEIVVLSGLEPGQQVVVSGQFLIDSEASLLGAYNRLGAEPGS